MHDVRDCLVVYRGRVMLEVPGPAGAERVQVVDPMRLHAVLNARAADVERYEGPKPGAIGIEVVEVWRREVERLAEVTPDA